VPLQLVLLLLFGGLMHAARSFVPDEVVGSRAAATALACGYLILSGFFLGQIFKRFGLPKLTGYLAAGIFVGPQVLGLVSSDMLASLKVFNGVAISLIALTAGLEMHWPSVRPLLRSIVWITLVAVVGTTLLLVGVAWLVLPTMPFAAAFSPAELLAVSAVVGVATVAQSPAVIVALRDETQADGPMIRTVMAVVVLADLVVISLFAVATTVARSVLGTGGDAVEAAMSLAWEFIGSGLAGALIGGLLALYLKRVGGGGGLFVVAVAFVTAEVGQRLHFDPLLVALSAGIVIRNATTVGDRLHHAIEAASLPVYVTFFALAGAKVELGALLIVGIPAILIVTARAFGFWAGTHVAARLADAPPVVGRYTSFGLMPQAGLALALGLLVERTFPDFGPALGVLVLGVVALNELLMPVLFRAALVRSGEAGALASPSAAPPSGRPPEPAATPLAPPAAQGPQSP
jgi:Kef-type K+ transport system membrane component KefB